ncbi:MAG: hypothetical protein IJW00_08860 [Clostridia bacterium]|nr:hypothetical protein [Clostridia bacterium]
MFSVITQEKTPLRDSRGGSVYRRTYLCDHHHDLAALPTDDAPASLCYVAETGKCYVLDHEKRWCLCPQGGVPWRG